MSNVSFLVTKEIIHLNFDGRYLKLTVHDKEFGEVRQLIKEGRKDEIPALLSRPAMKLEEYIEGSSLALVDGQVTDLEGNPLPKVLSDRLQEFKDEGFPLEGLVNFWNNLKQNPSKASQEQLYGFLENNGHPITDDGHFVAYRSVRSDFKDKYTGTIDNSPGSVCVMDRDKVNPDPYQTCSHGLHAASFNYAKNTYGHCGPNGTDVLLEVKINPRDVVAVPNDYSNQKMRVCRYEVIQVCEKELSTPLYGQPVKDWAYYKAEEEREPEPSEELVQEIIGLAQEFKNRYTDRNVLAVRIEEDLSMGYWQDDEEVTVDVALVLQVINDNADDIFTEDDGDSEDDDDYDS